MDSKPQPPLRVYQAAIRDSASAVPAELRSLHQRHKSAGNIKAMAVTSALNAPPKRTAFGDVSNITRAAGLGALGKLRAAPAVAATANNGDARAVDKENKVLIAGALKATGLKSGIPDYVVAANKARNNSINAEPAQSSVQLPLTKAAAPSKRPAAVYSDIENTRPTVGSSVDDLPALVDIQIKHPRHYKSQPLLRTEQGSLAQVQNKYTVKTDKLIEMDEEPDVDDDVTEAAYEDAVEQQSHNISHTSQASALVQQQIEREVAAQVEVQFHTQVDIPGDLRYKALPVPPAESPDEYWDDDDEQEIYEDQGYTTAHSYRSRGDNTTSGPTTLVAPDITAQVEQELARARDWVAKNITEEEVEEEAWDVSMVAEYGDEIFQYMRELEYTMTPNPHYMDIQTEIQWSMRSVLMDWLVQVHHRFCLLPETLFLTVNYVDRFLSVKVVSLAKLQLVGATALFVAAKYEEINCPSIQEIVYMVDSGYTVTEILKAERFMLSMLQFELGWPGPMSFLRRISKADDYDLHTRTLAKYFLEVTIMDERFVGCPPSFVAAGAHCLSRLFLDKGDWTLAHVHYSGYTMGQLRPLVSMMYECCRMGRKHHNAVFEKYAAPKYKCASTFVEREILRGVTVATLMGTPSGLRRSSLTLDNFTDGLHAVSAQA